MKNRKVMIALLLASSMAMAACGKKEAAQEAPEQPAVEEAAETEAQDPAADGAGTEETTETDAQDLADESEENGGAAA